MREDYFVVGEGVLSFDSRHRPASLRPSTTEDLRRFRFSRLGPTGAGLDEALRGALAQAMVAGISPDSADPAVPAGFTYLGQFVDHDLTLDNTAAAFGSDVSVADLLQGRSPALDLDALYGRGPDDRQDRRFYAEDGVHLKTGYTAPVTGNPVTDRALEGFDLPRSGLGSAKAERQAALIPDPRNDENLAVAQTHLAFIRFHNGVVDKLTGAGRSGPQLFRTAREMVVRHYQWMLRTDFLPRIVDPAVVDDVFTNGRRFFEVSPGYGPGGPRRAAKPVKPGDRPTMPIEFSVAAYRLGHSMVRDVYQWNRFFNAGGPDAIVPASLGLLFRFSGTSGNLSPDGDLDDPETGSFERLPTNWIADFRRLYDFAEAGRDDLVVPATDGNLTRRTDTLLVDPLAALPLGAFGDRDVDPPPIQRNLAFRNLTRALMVRLASGPQMAEFLQVPALSAEQIIAGAGGADLSGLSGQQRDALVANTPLWFYILREAEFNSGRLAGVGARIVAEVFHRAMEGSRISILRDSAWHPSLGPDPRTFRMVDLLLFAFEGKADLLNPLG